MSRRQQRRAKDEKPLSIVVILVATGEAPQLTPELKKRLIEGTCDLLEEHAESLGAPVPQGASGMANTT